MGIFNTHTLQKDIVSPCHNNTTLDTDTNLMCLFNLLLVFLCRLIHSTSPPVTGVRQVSFLRIDLSQNDITVSERSENRWPVKNGSNFDFGDGMEDLI